MEQTEVPTFDTVKTVDGEVQGAEGAPEAKTIDQVTLPETIDELEKVGVDSGSVVEAKEETKSESTKKETSEESEDDSEPSTGFVLPKDDSIPTLKSTSEEKETDVTWVGVGKELGIDLDEDNFDKFKSAIETKINASKVEADAKLERINNLSEDGKRFFEFLENDGRLEDFINPLKEFDSVLSLDDEGIVKKDLELKGWDSDKIEEKIEMLKDEGKLDTSAYELRKIVENRKNEFSDDLVEEQKAWKKMASEKFTQQLQKENTEITTTIDKFDQFLEIPLQKEVKDFLKTKWTNGEYRKVIQNNPDAVVKSMIFHYFGDQLSKDLRKKSYERGKDKVLEKLHNTPELTSEGGTKRETKTSVLDNPFQAWEDGMANA